MAHESNQAHAAHRDTLVRKYGLTHLKIQTAVALKSDGSIQYKNQFFTNAPTYASRQDAPHFHLTWEKHGVEGGLELAPIVRSNAAGDVSLRAPNMWAAVSSALLEWCQKLDEIQGATWTIKQ